MVFGIKSICLVDVSENIKGDVPKYAAPIRETDFSQLPATYTSVGTLDPYRDETIIMYKRWLKRVYPLSFIYIQAVIMNLNLSRQMHLLVNNPKRRRYKLLKQALTDEDASIKAKNIEK